MATDNQNFDAAVSECLSATTKLVDQARVFAERLRDTRLDPTDTEQAWLELQKVLIDEAHAHFVASSGLLLQQLRRS